MNKYWNVAKINIYNSKISFIISGILCVALLIELIFYLSFNPSSNGFLSIGNILLINLIFIPIFTVTINFKKMINLGMKKNEYFYGAFLSYLILATTLAATNILLYHIEEHILQNTNLWYINILDAFHWFQYGNLGCFIYQVFAYMVVMCFINYIAISNDNIIGWIISIILFTVIIVFISIQPLRRVLGIFLKSLIFNNSLLLQIIMGSIVISILYLLSKIFLKIKVL